MTARIITFYPGAYTGSGPSYTAISIALALAREGLDACFYCPVALRELPPGLQGSLIKLPRFPYKLFGKGPVSRVLLAIAERRVLAELDRRGAGAWLHLWGGASIKFVEQARARGAVIFREMINTHKGTAKRILDGEFARLGLPPQHEIDEEGVARQQAELALCDFFVSPSECVDASLSEWGFDRKRIVRTAFGWSLDRFASPNAQPAEGRHDTHGQTALFVGELSVRKGIHLALEAWRQAQVAGRFVLVGRVDPGFRKILAKHLGSESIEYHRFTHDIGSFYRSADYLFFPTLEEGAPLVCYEASGCGVPVITTRMGAARLIEHDVNGLIVDAHSQDDLVSAIRAMANDKLRMRLSRAAKDRAMARTWDAAAADRIAAFVALT